MTPLSRVAIVGVGAVGGSVGAGLRARGLATEVVGFDPANAALALETGLIDRAAPTLEDALHDAELLVLAAPVPANVALLHDPRLRTVLPARAAITDVSSTKSSVVAAARAGLGERHGRFVAAHPIAGSDRAGPRASRADLLEGAHLILCPTEACDADALARVEAIWAGLGARLARMSPEHHDRLFAEVSHWPHAVAFALAASVGQGPLADDARRWHGAGLRDTTRVGGSPPELWAGILLDNRGPALEAAAAFRAELERIERALADGDRDALIDALARGASWRSTL